MFINRWLRNFCEKKTDNLINSLQNTKENLKEIIENSMRDALMKRFKKLSYEDIIAQHGDKIEKIRAKLYNKYNEEINARINVLEVIKKYDIPGL